jgi:hypothetical protein
MITVNKNSWHFKLYRWWYDAKFGKERVWDDYIEPIKPLIEMTNEEYRRYMLTPAPFHWVSKVPRNTNLCPYMRAVMFWAPLRFLFINGKVKKVPMPAILAVATFLAINIFLFFAHMKVFVDMWKGLVLGSIVLGLIYAMVIGIEKWRKKPVRYKEPKQGNSFVKLLKDYSQSKHDQICPPVHFTE